MSTPLPIDPFLPQIVDGLRTGNRLVLRAAPGAGKTTRVPAALLDAGLPSDRHVLVLEPRRIAARAAAEFVARARGGTIGGEVGYRVRFEQRGGAATRLWFLTEGVLGRQLARDPFLEAAAVVVLDEFHERHLQGDVALAVVRELQETVRPDLRQMGDVGYAGDRGARLVPWWMSGVDRHRSRLSGAGRVCRRPRRSTAGGAGGQRIAPCPGRHDGSG